MKNKMQQLLSAAQEFNEIVFGESKYSDFPIAVPKKTIFERFIDNAKWVAKHGEVNKNYFLYGLHIKDSSDPHAFLPLRMARRKRDQFNQSSDLGYNYICLLRDKFVFGEFLAGLGFPTPRNVALGREGVFRWLDQGYVQSVCEKGFGFRAMIKEIDGLRGQGVFEIELLTPRKFRFQGEVVDEDYLLRIFKNGFVIQERITQHESLARIHPPSVNSLRILSVKEKGVATVVASHLRIGARGNATDSYHVGGGMRVKIDIDTGFASEYAYGDSGITLEHPDTGVKYSEVVIPYWQKLCKMITELHEYVPIHSIGWDVAIGVDGPIVIEGNDNWTIPMVQAFNPGLLKRIYNM